MDAFIQTCIAHVHRQPTPQLPISSTKVAEFEHKTHIRFLSDIAAQNWHERTQIGSKLVDIVERALQKPAFIQFYGSSGCGKSASLCWLFQMLKERESDCYAVIRFAHITDGSVPLFPLPFTCSPYQYRTLDPFLPMSYSATYFSRYFLYFSIFTHKPSNEESSFRYVS